MKIQTTNRLAHLQVELQETTEQNRCLQMQVAPKQNEVTSLEQYVRVNNGDKRIVSRYKKSCRELNTLLNQIRRNNAKICNLQYRIEQESVRASMGYQRMPRKRVY